MPSLAILKLLRRFWGHAETSEILVSREISRTFFHFHFSFSISSRFNFTFTSRKRVKGFYFSLFTSRKKWNLFVFHSFYSRKRVKSGAGYNLTSIFVPNCISKYCQISSMHQPQNIGKISVLKSWPNPVLHVWTNQKKVTKNSALISWPNFSSLPNCR